jgi:hypothetical protein
VIGWEESAIRISDRSEYLVVAATVAGILSAIYFHVTEFLEHEGEPLATVVLFHVLPSLWINCGILYNFLMAILTNPGVPDSTHAEGGTTCRHCSGPQPPMSAHCVTCNQCVLYMDHHCPFTANCVGQHNFPYFFGFVLWSWVATLYAVWLSNHPNNHCTLTEDGTIVCDQHTKRSLQFVSAAMCCVLTGFLVSLACHRQFVWVPVCMFV